MKEKFVFDESLLGEKKHIIITGPRGVGKTTLLKDIERKLIKSYDMPGLITWAVCREAVYLSKKGDDKKIKIGEYNPDSIGKENRMKPIYDSFNISGVEILEELINDTSEWISIDEIGYLESACEAYVKKLNEVFERKRVVAVVRMQNTELLNGLCSRKDALIINLEYLNNLRGDHDID